MVNKNLRFVNYILYTYSLQPLNLVNRLRNYDRIIFCEFGVPHTCTFASLAVSHSDIWRSEGKAPCFWCYSSSISVDLSYESYFLNRFSITAFLNCFRIIWNFITWRTCFYIHINVKKRITGLSFRFSARFTVLLFIYLFIFV